MNVIQIHTKSIILKSYFSSLFLLVTWNFSNGYLQRLLEFEDIQISKNQLLYGMNCSNYPTICLYGYISLLCRQMASGTVSDEKELHCAVDHMKRVGQLIIVVNHCHAHCFAQRYTPSF